MRKILAILTIISVLNGSLSLWAMEDRALSQPKSLFANIKEWWNSIPAYESREEEDAETLIIMTLLLAYAAYNFSD